MTKEERDIAVFALRYSFGRRTYAFSTVTDYIRQNVKSFEAWELGQMAEETRRAVMWHDIPDYEKADYFKFANEMDLRATEVNNEGNG